jgi:hypothetical protein
LKKRTKIITDPGGLVMAELKLVSLQDVFSDAQVKKLSRKLKEFGADLPEESPDAVGMEEAISDDQLADFFDRLEAHEIACDIYLPLEFEGRTDMGDGLTVGSAYTLLEALEELREELDLDAEEHDEDEDLDYDQAEEQLEYAWQVFAKIANAAVEQRLSLHVVS